MTNNHVVASGKSFEVTTDDGKTYQAKVIGTDPQTDVALIKVSVPTDFPYVKFAANEPRIGDWVLVVGNPFGLGGTVTAGIVSARGRDIGAGPYDDFIQIDAPVNKGNSGGPTFNVKGEVIGVNTAIYSPSGGSVGVAFDIPAETVKLVIQQLKDKGHVTRGWIGVQIQPVTPAIADTVGLKKPAGALVALRQPNSPAAKGGLSPHGSIHSNINSLELRQIECLYQTNVPMSTRRVIFITMTCNVDMLSPPLTTVRIAQRNMGNQAAHLLLDQIADPTAHRERVVLEPRLIVRGSTAAPRGVKRPLQKFGPIHNDTVCAPAWFRAITIMVF